MNVGLVVDSSAVVALLTGEPSSEALTELIEGSAELVMSAATLVEAGIVVESRLGPGGGALLQRLLDRLEVEIVPVDRATADTALDAWRRFGKGRHPAGLNYGDCFTYALADATGFAVLCVGDDFTRTDVPVASPPEGLPA